MPTHAELSERLMSEIGCAEGCDCLTPAIRLAEDAIERVRVLEAEAMRRDPTPTQEDMGDENMTLVERLKSRAWEHRQHRALREEAARRIAKLEAELNKMRHERDALRDAKAKLAGNR